MSIEEITYCQTKASEREAKELEINGRLNETLSNVKSNLTLMQEINSNLLGPMPCKEEQGKKSAPNGWFNEVIEILVTVNSVNYEMKKELINLRKELSK